MKQRAAFLSCLLFGACLSAREPEGEPFHPQIPRIWEDEALHTTELPLAGLEEPARHVSADYYYRIPVRPVYKTYSVYDPSREPKGYWDWLCRREPETIFDPSKLRTRADWVRAGELIFAGAGDLAGDLNTVRDVSWWQQLRPPATQDGIDLTARYIVTSKVMSSFVT